MSLKDLSNEALSRDREEMARWVAQSEAFLAADRRRLEAIDAELKRREQKPVLRMEAEFPLGSFGRVGVNGSRIADIHTGGCRINNIDPAAIARKISVVEMMWALLRYSVDERNWMAFMRDEYGVAVQPDASAHFCESYIRAVVEGREPTAEEKAAWGIVD